MSEANGSKRWCFTINNPTFEDEELFLGTPADGPQANMDAVEYMVFQEERGAQGTLHWQGFLILKERKRLTWMKRNMNPRAHWEVARGTNEQCRNYCTKEDTYTGGIRKEIGKMPERKPAPKKEERLQRAAEELDQIKEGYKRPADIDSYTLMQCGFIPAYKELTADVLGPYRPKLKIITLIGPPGTGKSYAIQHFFPDHGSVICGNNGVWFQQPLAKVMVLEEFSGQIPLTRMLQLLDAYPLALEVKGGMRPAMYDTFIITSNTTPDMWYKGMTTPDGTAPVNVADMQRRIDALHALFDRLGYSGGGYIPVRKCGHYLQAPSVALTLDMSASDYIKHCREYFWNSLAEITGLDPIELSEDEQQDNQ